MEPFASNPANQKFVAQVQKQFNVTPDKFMALGGGSLHEGAKVVESTKTLDRKTVAEAIRSHTIKDTIFGDAAFAANRQMQSSYAVFTVTNGKLVVEK